MTSRAPAPVPELDRSFLNFDETTNETHEAWSTMRRESGGHHQPREARLRSASAHLFPGVPADVWIQAASMADIVASKRLQRGDITFAERVLDPAHFEFRQGGRQPETETPSRRRATDRLRLQGD